MEQTIMTNTEGSPKKSSDQTALQSVDETFRPLQEKLNAVDEYILEQQKKLEVEEQRSHDLQAKIDHEQQINRELTIELRKALDEQNNIKSILSKERDILKLKYLELEQQVPSTEQQSTDKAWQESSHKKDDTKTDAGLKKLGLTENILLALPFGYATKVRSAFEKLSYENEKLSKENAELLEKNATLIRQIEQLKGESLCEIKN